MRLLLRTLLLGTFAFTLAACGGGGGGGGGGTTPPPPPPPPPPPAAPTGAMSFPPPVSLTDSSSITARGTATGETDISSVTVNDVTATLTGSGTSRGWSAQVALPADTTTTLDVTVRDSGDRTNADPITADVIRRQYVRVPTTFAYDVEGDIAYGFVGAAGEIVAINLEDGTGDVLATLPEFFFNGANVLQLLSYDAVNDRVIGTVRRDGSLGVFAVTTGGTVTTRQFDNVVGTTSMQLRDVALAADGSAVYALLSTQTETSIHRITLPPDGVAGAAISVVTSNSVGSGANLDASRGIAFAGDRLLVLDGPFGAEGGGSIRSVLLADGTRSGALVSPQGEFVALFRTSANIDVDQTGNNAYVTGIDHVLSVVIDAGTVTNLSPATANTEFFISQPRTTVLDETNGRLLIGDVEFQTVGSIDLTSGDRTELFGVGIGDGPRLRAPAGLAADTANERVFVFDTGGNVREAVFEIALTSGARTQVSDIAQPSSVVDVGGIVHDAGNNRLLLLFLNQVLAVNLATEQVTVVSSPTVGSGPNFNAGLGIALDSANNRALVVSAASPSALLAIDLTTGNRTVVSGAVGGTTTGTGAAFQLPFDVVLGGSNTAYVIDRGRGELLSVNLENGNRTVARQDCVDNNNVDHLAPGNVGLRKLAYDAERNEVLMTAARLLVFDVAGNSCAARGNFQNRPLLDLDIGADGRLFGTSANMLLAIDRASGEHVILSK